MENLVVLFAIVAIIYLLFSNRKKENIDSTQDLFNYKEIASDGLIHLPGQKFRKVIQVYPLNIATRSGREQASIWDTFRTMVNSLVFPVTFLVQSTHLDTEDYTAQVEEERQRSENDLVREVGKDYINHIRELSEKRSIRSHKYFVIVKIDVSSASIDSGVEVEDNTVAMAINSVLKAANKPKKMSDKEAERLARSELDNMTNIIRSYLSQMGISSTILDRRGVVDMGYTTYNRDLSNVVRTKEVDDIEAFSLFTKSLTPDLYGKTLTEEGDSVKAS